MARRPSIAFVGCGRAGGAIGLALKGAGYPVVAAWSRSRAGRQRAHRLLDVPVLSTPADVARAADITFVAVSDDAIADIAHEVAPGVRKGRHVLHTSGGVSTAALEAVREAGGRIGSLHPLQALTGARKGAEALKGAAVAVTSADADHATLFRIARAWGGRPFLLPDEAKTAYHAAAVFSSNYLVTSIWAATTLLRDIGVTDPRTILAPLIEATVENVVHAGPEKALTGPVARGDAGTVRRHVEALRSDAKILEGYRAMARLTAHLAGTSPVIEKATT